jgi:predicted amidophosphoribosyltransferase
VLLDLVLPRRCACCALPGTDLCESCLLALPRIRAPLCERCGAPTAWPVRRCRECAGRRIAFATARAAVRYEREARLLVAAWKERALRGLVAVAAALLDDAVARPLADALAFVPADPDRGLRRGHHPAAALADRMGTIWEMPVLPLLERPHAGKAQRELGLADRRRNVAGAFAASRAPPARVVLVDDVYTTGATASEAAGCLRRAGARRVDVLTFARTVRHR